MPTMTTRERLEKATSELKSYADELDTKGENPSAEEVEKLTEMSVEVKSQFDALRAAATATGTVDFASAYLAELSGDTGAKAVETDDSKVDSKSGIIDPNGMTFGEAIVKSPAYQDILSRYKGSDGRIQQGFGRVTVQDGGTFYGKSLVTGLSSTSGGALVVNQRLPQITDLIGERRLTVRDLCTNISLDSDTLEYVRITGKTNNAAAVLEPTTAATPGLNNVAVAAYGASHGMKPESALALDVVSTPVETIAHGMPVTRRAFQDAGQLRQLIEAFLLYGLKEEEEDQILNGSGSSPNLTGILTDGAISTVGSAGTDLDAVVDAVRTIRADNREPNAMVVHPNDWYSTGFLLAKDSAGNYIVGDPRASIDQLNSLWGLRVVVTPAMTENTLLVADFKQVLVGDRMQSQIFATDSHNDHFMRNIIDLLAEERIAVGVLDPDAVCTVTAV